MQPRSGNSSVRLPYLEQCLQSYAPVKHECDLIVFCKLDGENLSLKSSNGGLLSVNLNIKANKYNFFNSPHSPQSLVLT
jgi:hypothetical protein